MSDSKGFADMKKGLDLQQAIAEANRCLLCHDAPCSKGCPAGTDPATFIRKLRFRNVTGAIRTIKENNMLGGACGALCPSHRLCEKECSATGIDRPIDIAGIQRALVEHSWKLKFSVFEKRELSKERVAVVGSGPAGLSCAAELAKDGYRVVVFEEKSEPGGVLRYGVPAYRFSKDFLNREIEDLKTLGVEFRCSSPVRSVEKLLDDGFKAVFLAPGLWQPMRLNGKSKGIPGLFTSTDYLASLRDGDVAHVARYVEGRRVAVIGGGSVAIDCAESAVKLGAKDVYLVYRRSFSEMPAEPDERIHALNQGVQLLCLNQPKDYVVDDKGMLTGLKLVRTILGEKDSSGRRSPKEVVGSEWILSADAVVEAIGSKPADESPSWYPDVKVSDGKLISVDPKTGRTSSKAVFAGGDIVRGPALIVDAIEDGKKAAKAIKEQLNS